MFSCLIASALWAISLSLFRGPIRALGPAPVNFFKAVLASVFFWSFILIPGQWRQVSGQSPRDLLLLALSGLVGMAFGDLLLFVAVREGGVQRALVLFNTSPLMTALLAIPFLGEVPSLRSWLGMLLVLAGVMLVETDPARRGSENGPHGAMWKGTLAGLGAALGQALGILMSRDALARVPVLPASALRLSAAAVGMLFYLLWTSSSREQIRGLTLDRWPRLALPSVIGTVIAVLFMMKGISEIPSGISAALLATTPLFSLPLSYLFLKEHLGPRSIPGTLLAVFGVVLL